jgi:hypothetical protein
MPPVTLEQVQSAIMAGRPGTFDTAATAFDHVLATLQSLTDDIPSTVGAVVGEGKAWSGPAATVFVGVADEVVDFIRATIKPLRPYGTTMTTAGGALTTARRDIVSYAADMATYRATEVAAGRTPDEAAINAGAREILERLAAAYRTAQGALVEIPTTPEDVDGDGEGGEGGSGGGGGTVGAVSSGPMGGFGDGFTDGPSLTLSPPGFMSALSGGGPGPVGLDGLGLRSLGLPSFDLASETGPSSTVLTGLTTPGGGPQLPLAPGVGTPGTETGFASRLPFGMITATDRLPGLGASGYSQPPGAPVSVRSGFFPPMWSQYGVGSRGGSVGGRGARRRRRVQQDGESIVVHTALSPIYPPTGGAAGRRDRRQERITSLVGDEDWTDPADGDAIGRPPTPPADRD